jgi:hypothetical protein
LDKGNAKPLLFFVQNHVFRADALSIRAKNTVGARERAKAATSVSIEVAGYIELQ